jgi:hypothetical protein
MSRRQRRPCDEGVGQPEPGGTPSTGAGGEDVSSLLEAPGSDEVGSPVVGGEALDPNHAP